MLDPSRAEALERIEMAALTPIYEEALAADPGDLGAIHFLGHAYTRLGRHEEALRMDERLTELLPEDAVARYNLACSYALLGRRDEAFEALEHSIRLGYREPDHMREDPDLEPIREDPRFAEIVTRLVRETGSGG